MAKQVEGLLCTGVGTSRRDAINVAAVASDILGINFIAVPLSDTVDSPERFIGMANQLPWVITHSSAAATMDGSTPEHFCSIAAPTNQPTRELMKATPGMLFAQAIETIRDQDSRTETMLQGARAALELALHPRPHMSAVNKIAKFCVLEQLDHYLHSHTSYTLATQQDDKFFKLDVEEVRISFPEANVVTLKGGHNRVLTKPESVFIQIHESMAVPVLERQIG